MHRLILAAALLAACFTPADAAGPADGFPPLVSIETPPQPGAIPLYPSLKPGAYPENWATMNGDAMARNVTVPTLTPVLPPAGTANGTAMIVAPGGAFMALSMDNEGLAVARALASQG